MAELAESTSIFGQSKQFLKEKISCGFYVVHATNPLVLRAVMRQALSDQSTLLVEFNQPQPNLPSKMRPVDFASYIYKLASENNFPSEKLLLAGGQMHRETWQAQPNNRIHEEAAAWVVECVNAGFEKIFLESCGQTDPWRIAELQADLCHVAETAFDNGSTGKEKPHYILGTPFSAMHTKQPFESAAVGEQVKEIWEAGQKAFQQAGLQNAWQRVIAIAVQPGIGYRDYEIVPYQSGSARDLKELSEKHNQFVYEIRAADYQPESSLENLLTDYFMFLGIGPQLTFAMREAMFSLAMMENQWLIGKPGARLSNLIVELDKAMQLDPRHWKDRVGGNGFEQLLARKFSYQDMSNHYWQVEDVRAAQEQLMKNLGQDPPPLPMLRQFFPDAYELVRDGKIRNQPEDLIVYRIQRTLKSFTKMQQQHRSKHE